MNAPTDLLCSYLTRSVLTFKLFDALEACEGVYQGAPDAEDLVPFRQAAPAADRSAGRGLRAAALDKQPSHRLARLPSALEPQSKTCHG